MSFILPNIQVHSLKIKDYAHVQDRHIQSNHEREREREREDISD